MFKIGMILWYFIAIVRGLGIICYFTLLERNIIGAVQLRTGPQKIGPLGLLQPVIDGGKLLIKIIYVPYQTNLFAHLLAPVIALLLPFLLWFIIPLIRNPFSSRVRVRIILCLSSLAVYPILIRGWASNNKYRMIGSVRALAQVISYEVRIVFIVITLILPTASMNFIHLTAVRSIPIIILPLVSSLWLLTILAETSRTPFDLPEGERELVSGYNTEYIGRGFTLLFIAEYLHIVVLRVITRILLLSSNLYFLLVLVIIIICRASFPRLRVDKLIYLVWGSVLPISISFLYATAIFICYIGGLAHLI